MKIEKKINAKKREKNKRKIDKKRYHFYENSNFFNLNDLK